MSNGIVWQRVRCLKTALFAFALVGMFYSCATQRRCIEKYPPEITIVEHDSVIWRDTVIYVQLPADTLRDTAVIIINEPSQPEQLKVEPLQLKTRFATADAWITGDELNLRLVQDAKMLAFVIDSAVVERMKTITVTQGQVIEKKYIPMLYKFSMIFSCIVLFLILVKIILSSLKK